MTDLVISENDLQTCNEAMESLEHHGILGQKWGKKQGPPYPLDPEDHSASEKKSGWRKSLEGATKKIKSATAKAKAELAEKKSQKAAQNEEKKEEENKPLDKRAVINSADANTIAANASQLTTQELQEAVNRMNLMQQVNSKVPNPPTVQDKINGAINKLDQAATTVTKGIDAYNKVARIYNKFQTPPLPVLDSSAADRAKKMADDKKAEVEKQRKELVEKAVKSGDPAKILQVQGIATNEELGGAVKRVASINTLTKYLNGEDPSANGKKQKNGESQQQQSKQEKKQDSKPKEETKPKQETKAEETPKQTETKKSEPSYAERLGDLANKSVNGNNGWTTPEEREERIREANRLYDEGVERLRKEAYSRRLSDMATEKAWDDLLERASRNK